MIAMLEMFKPFGGPKIEIPAPCLGGRETLSFRPAHFLGRELSASNPLSLRAVEILSNTPLGTEARPQMSKTEIHMCTSFLFTVEEVPGLWRTGIRTCEYVIPSHQSSNTYT